jgi:hypothetical protein
MLLPDVAEWGRRVDGSKEAFMTALFAKTWFLWWLLASVVVLRWFQSVAVVDPRDTQDPPKRDKNEHTIPGQWASRA